MVRAYRTITPQLVNKHIDRVRREIELEKRKQDRALEIDLETGYTEQVISQAERYYRDISSSQARMKQLQSLLDELELKALPASVDGEYRRMISGIENNISNVEKEIERLHMKNAPVDLIESVEKRLMDSRTELKQALEVRPS